MYEGDMVDRLAFSPYNSPNYLTSIVTEVMPLHQYYLNGYFLFRSSHSQESTVHGFRKISVKEWTCMTFNYRCSGPNNLSHPTDARAFL